MKLKSVRWCYLAFGYDCRDEMGVVKKIKMQTKAIDSMAGGCDAIYFHDGIAELFEHKDEKETITELVDMNRIYEQIDQYDYLYYRWGGSDKLFNNILKYSKKNGIINIVEVPTYPMVSAHMGLVKVRLQEKNYWGAIRLFGGVIYIDKILFRIQKRLTDYFVLSSMNQSVKGASTINILNGIKVEAVPQRNIPDNKRDIFTMLVVANVSVWHGIDRIVKGIEKYKGQKDIRLLVVGDGEELPYIKKLVKDTRLNKKVSFEGYKFGAELDSYFDSCDIAIGSLGLHRLKVRPSTLKSKEYMARGIPFIVSKTEADNFDESVYEYLFFIEENEEPLDIEAVMNWYESINLITARQEMRKYAELNYSWDKQMKKVVDAVYKNK